MEDVCSKLQEMRNPAHAIGLIIREIDYETDVDMETGFNPGRNKETGVPLSAVDAGTHSIAFISFQLSL